MMMSRYVLIKISNNIVKFDLLVIIILLSNQYNTSIYSFSKS